MNVVPEISRTPTPWNKGKLVGQKAPLRLRDIAHGACISPRAIVMQQKTHQPVQFEITEQTRIAIMDWIQLAQLRNEDFLFPSRINCAKHLSTRQYARIVKAWVTGIGLDASVYGTHTMRRTKVSLIYRRMNNLRAVQLLLGHTKLKSTFRYLGIEDEDALEMAEQTEVCPARSGHSLQHRTYCSSDTAENGHYPNLNIPIPIRASRKSIEI